MSDQVLSRNPLRDIYPELFALFEGEQLPETVVEIAVVRLLGNTHEQEGSTERVPTITFPFREMLKPVRSGLIYALAIDPLNGYTEIAWYFLRGIEATSRTTIPGEDETIASYVMRYGLYQDTPRGFEPRLVFFREYMRLRQARPSTLQEVLKWCAHAHNRELGAHRYA